MLHDGTVKSSAHASARQSREHGWLEPELLGMDVVGSRATRTLILDES